MRSVEVAADRALVVVERHLADPEEGQVLLNVAYCGICGSDLHFRDSPALFPAGSVPGHEISGRVASLGPGVEGWSAGDRVSVLPFAQCGACELCLGGDEHVCPHAVAGGVGLGTGRPGGYAERMVADARMLFALPDAVDDRAGAFAEPLAVALHAIAKAGPAEDDPVVVLGAGPIGLLTGLVLRERGLRRFAVVSRNVARARRAAALGLPTVPYTDDASELADAFGDVPACVLECAGSPAAASLAVELVRPLGRVILVGIALEPLGLSAPLLVLKEVAVLGALTYRRAEFAEAIDLLARGRIPTDDLVTAVAPLERAEAMFQALVAPGNSHVKVLLRP